MTNRMEFWLEWNSSNKSIGKLNNKLRHNYIIHSTLNITALLYGIKRYTLLIVSSMVLLSCSNPVEDLIRDYEQRIDDRSTIDLNIEFKNVDIIEDIIVNDSLEILNAILAELSEEKIQEHKSIIEIFKEEEIQVDRINARVEDAEENLEYWQNTLNETEIPSFVRSKINDSKE